MHFLIHSRLLANKVFMRIFFTRALNLEIYSSIPQSSRQQRFFCWKYWMRNVTLEHVNHPQCDDVSFSLEFVEISVAPRIFRRSPKEAPVSWLELGRKCCLFFSNVQTSFCLALLCPFNVVEDKHEYHPLIRRFWCVRSEYASGFHQQKHL